MIIGEKAIKMKLCQSQHPGKKLLLDAKILFEVTPTSVQKKNQPTRFSDINWPPRFNKKGKKIRDHHLNVL